MAGIPSNLPLGEGFTVYRETRTVHIIILLNEDYLFPLYIVTPRVAAVSEDTMEVRLLIVPDEAVEPDMDSV